MFIHIYYIYIYIYVYIYIYWLVVLTILKNISQMELLLPIYDRKINNVPNHQPVYIYIVHDYLLLFSYIIKFNIHGP